MSTALPYKITKLDAAERKLIAAVRGFFNNEDAVVVYSLAGDAAEVLDALCRKQGLESYREIAIDTIPDLTHKAMSDMINRHRNFFKHARGDEADAVIEDFSDENNDPLLFIASYDLIQLTAKMGRSCPVDAQMYSAWYMALHVDAADPARLAAGLPDIIPLLFPELRRRPRYEQKAMGRHSIAWARNEPLLNQPVPRSDLSEC